MQYKKHESKWLHLLVPNQTKFYLPQVELNQIILFCRGYLGTFESKIHGPNFDQNHIITSSIEHEAILQPCKGFENIEIKTTYIPVDEHGIVEPNDITNSINSRTVLVSIMFANNEVGTIQPIKEISEICKKYQIPLHTDAIQAVGKVPINVKELGVDALSISSHKINGPKGVGALFIKKGLTIDSLISGGGQENGLRSGTENVASIVGFGKACEIAKERLNENISHFQTLTLFNALKNSQRNTSCKT